VTKLKKLFGLKREDPVSLVRKNMIRRTFESKDKKKKDKKLLKFKELLLIPD